MNDEHQRRGAGGWLVLAVFCALLLALATFVVMRSRSTHSAVIRIDSNGTTRLGPLSLGNTNLRDAAFTAVGHLNKGTVGVSAAHSTKMSDLVKTVDAMQRAGITSLTFRTERSPSSNEATITNR